RVAGGYHAGEPVDALCKLHSSELFDIAVDTGRFIRRNRHDLACAEKSALGVDLVGGKGMPFQCRSPQSGAGSRLKGHMADREGGGGNLSFRLGARPRAARGAATYAVAATVAATPKLPMKLRRSTRSSMSATPIWRHHTGKSSCRRDSGCCRYGGNAGWVKVDSDMQKGPP